MLGQKLGMSAPALELLRIKPTRSVYIPTVSINSIVAALKKKNEDINREVGILWIPGWGNGRGTGVDMMKTHCLQCKKLSINKRCSIF